MAKNIKKYEEGTRISLLLPNPLYKKISKIPEYDGLKMTTRVLFIVMEWMKKKEEEGK